MKASKLKPSKVPYPKGMVTPKSGTASAEAFKKAIKTPLKAKGLGILGLI